MRENERLSNDFSQRGKKFNELKNTNMTLAAAASSAEGVVKKMGESMMIKEVRTVAQFMKRYQDPGDVGELLLRTA